MKLCVILGAVGTEVYKVPISYNITTNNEKTCVLDNLSSIDVNETLKVSLHFKGQRMESFRSTIEKIRRV
jgi:hypothetical protein